MVVEQRFSKEELQEILEEEAFLIKHSGETPEIAYHSGLYYLFEDPEGPGLKPQDVDLAPMKQAVFERYCKILLRDLKPANRDRKIYRGIARSIANWHRLKRFCQKEGFQIDEIKKETAQYLIHFLHKEVEDVASGRRSSCINCTYEEILDFAKELGVDQKTLPSGLRTLCWNQ